MVMKVAIYDCGAGPFGGDLFRCEADLAECFEADDPELAFVEADLRETGEAMVGGGAAPPVMLREVPVERFDPAVVATALGLAARGAARTFNVGGLA